MNIDLFVNEFAKRLKSDDFFNDIKIVKPFANASYSGQIKQNVVALYLGSTQFFPCEIGDNAKSGEASIRADIYVPHINADFAKTIFYNICRVSGDCDVVSIKSYKCEYSKYAKAVVLKSEFTFKTNFEFGGESGGR